MNCCVRNLKLLISLINMKSEIKIIGRSLSAIFRHMRVFMDKNLEQYNINDSHLPILIITADNEGIQQNEISKILNIHRANTTRAVKKLEEKGYLIRKVDQKNHRNYKLFLTEKAKKRRTKIGKIFNDWIDILLSDFNKEERKLFIDFLERAAKNAVSIKEMGDFNI